MERRTSERESTSFVDDTVWWAHIDDEPVADPAGGWVRTASPLCHRRV